MLNLFTMCQKRGTWDDRGMRGNISEFPHSNYETIMQCRSHIGEINYLEKNMNELQQEYPKTKKKNILRKKGLHTEKIVIGSYVEVGVIEGISG